MGGGIETQTLILSARALHTAAPCPTCGSAFRAESAACRLPRSRGSEKHRASHTVCVRTAGDLNRLTG
jgi:hypothetical protein